MYAVHHEHISVIWKEPNSPIRPQVIVSLICPIFQKAEGITMVEKGAEGVWPRCYGAGEAACEIVFFLHVSETSWAKPDILVEFQHQAAGLCCFKVPKTSK